MAWKDSQLHLGDNNKNVSATAVPNATTPRYTYTKCQCSLVSSFKVAKPWPGVGLGGVGEDTAAAAICKLWRIVNVTVAAL